MKSIFIALALAGIATPAFAQTMSGNAPMASGGMAMGGGMMTAQDVGASPMTGTPSQQYVNMAADGDMYEIKSSKMALKMSKNPEVKSFAKDMIADHMKTTASLKMALPKTSPKVMSPPMKPTPDTMAKLAALKSAGPSGFDALYVQQQTAAHQMAWSLHSGYAADGADPALKQVAMGAVPIVEGHLKHLKMMPASMGGM